jgi:hypothetical protein
MSRLTHSRSSGTGDPAIESRTTKACPDRRAKLDQRRPLVSRYLKLNDALSVIMAKRGKKRRDHVLDPREIGRRESE